jgi:hypothetical protein
MQSAEVLYVLGKGLISIALNKAIPLSGCDFTQQTNDCRILVHSFRREWIAASELRLMVV